VTKNLYSDYATGWTVRVSNTDGGKRLSLFRKPVQNGHVVPSLFLEGKTLLEPRFKTGISINHSPFCACAGVLRGDLYLYFLVNHYQPCK